MSRPQAANQAIASIIGGIALAAGRRDHAAATERARERHGAAVERARAAGGRRRRSAIGRREQHAIEAPPVVPGQVPYIREAQERER